MHYSSFKGCTLFGKSRWSRGQRQAAKVLLPLLAPLVVAGVVVMGVGTMLMVPPIAASDEWRRSKASPGRFRRTVFAGLASAVVAPLFLTAGVLAVSGRVVTQAYIVLPYKALRSVVTRHGTRRGADTTSRGPPQVQALTQAPVLSTPAQNAQAQSAQAVVEVPASVVFVDMELSVETAEEDHA